MNPVNFLIILIFFSLLCLFLLLFNAFFNQKYLDFSCASNIFVIITITLLLAYNYFNQNWLLKSLTAVAFICGIYFGYASILNLLELSISRWVRWLALCILLIDFFAYPFLISLSIFLHKVVLMTIFLYLAVKILKHKHKSLSIYLLASTILLFSSFQIVVFLVFFLGEPFHLFWDNMSYIIQNFICSLLYVFISIEHSKNSYSAQVSALKHEAVVTENKLKEFNELSQVKGDLFASLSHELKTPINIIYSNVQLFEQFLNTTTIETSIDCNKYLNSMRKNCFRLINLVNNIIDINKVESGHMEAELKNYDIIPWLEDLVSSINPFALQKHISLIFDTEHEEFILAYDADKTEKIVLNILSNAIKYTPNGGEILVYVSTTCDYLSIAVQDTGIGIPEHLHESIFDRFTQNRGILHKNHDGSGIGLSLVKSLVTLQDGLVTIDKTYTNGTKFVFCLPLKTIKEKENIPLADIPSNKLFIEFY